jgi:hypothetical protein
LVSSDGLRCFAAPKQTIGNQATQIYLDTIKDANTFHEGSYEILFLAQSSKIKFVHTLYLIRLNSTPEILHLQTFRAPGMECSPLHLEVCGGNGAQ